jgi:hypothetical protein
VQQARAVKNGFPERRATTAFGQLPKNDVLQAKDLFGVPTLISLTELVVEFWQLPEAPCDGVLSITGKSRFDQVRDLGNLGPNCFHHALPVF